MPSLEPLGTFSPSIKNKKAGITLTQLQTGAWDINEQAEGAVYFAEFNIVVISVVNCSVKEEVLKSVPVNIEIYSLMSATVADTAMLPLFNKSVPSE